MALNEFQKQLAKFEKQYGKGTQAYNDAVTRYTLERFGPIDESLIPTDATVNYRSPDGSRLEYTDAQGYRHVLQRNLDARLANFGQVNETDDRPAVLPPTQTTPGLAGLLDNAIRSITGGLATLTPQDQALLQTMSSAEQEQLKQKQTQDTGTFLAGQYGMGTERSTLANDLAAKLQQAQGLVLNQQQAGAANRELALKQFTTGIQSGLVTGLTNQDLQAQIASATNSIQEQQLNQSNEQFYQQLLLEQEKLKAQQKKSPLSGILGSLISAGLSFIPGAGPVLSGIFQGASKGITDSNGTYLGE